MGLGDYQGENFILRFAIPSWEMATWSERKTKRLNVFGIVTGFSVVSLTKCLFIKKKVIDEQMICIFPGFVKIFFTGMIELERFKIKEALFLFYVFGSCSRSDVHVYVCSLGSLLWTFTTCNRFTV